MFNPRKRKADYAATSASKRSKKPAIHKIDSSDDEPDVKLVPQKNNGRVKKPKADKLKVADFVEREMLKAPVVDDFPHMKGGNVHIVLEPRSPAKHYFILKKDDLIRHSIFFKNLLNQENPETRPQFSRTPHKNDIYLELLKTKGTFELVRRPIYYQKITEDELQENGILDTVVADDCLYSQADPSQPFEAFLSKSSANSISNPDNAIRIDATDDEAEVEQFTEKLHDSYRVCQKMSRSICSLVVDSEDESKDELVECQNGSKKRRSKSSSTQTEYSSSEATCNTNSKQTDLEPQSEEAMQGSKISSSYSNVPDPTDIHSQRGQANSGIHDSHDEDMTESVTGTEVDNTLVVQGGGQLNTPATTSAMMGALSVSPQLIYASPYDDTTATVKSSSAIAAENISLEPIPMDRGNNRTATGVTDNDMVSTPGSVTTTTLPGLKCVSSSVTNPSSEAVLNAAGPDKLVHDPSANNNNDHSEDSDAVNPSPHDTAMDYSDDLVFSSPPPISSSPGPSSSSYSSTPSRNSSHGGYEKDDNSDRTVACDIIANGELNLRTSSSESIPPRMDEVATHAAPFLISLDGMPQDDNSEKTFNHDLKLSNSLPLGLPTSIEQLTTEVIKGSDNCDDITQETVQKSPCVDDCSIAMQETQQQSQIANSPHVVTSGNTTASPEHWSECANNELNVESQIAVHHKTSMTNLSTPPSESDMPLSSQGRKTASSIPSLGGMDGAGDTYDNSEEIEDTASSSGLPGPCRAWSRVLAMLSHVKHSPSHEKDFLRFCKATMEDLALASELQCMDLVRSIRLKESQRYRGQSSDDIAQFPLQMLTFSLDLQSRPLFDEAYIHVVGYCLNDQSRQEKVRNDFAEFEVRQSLLNSIKQAEDMIINVNEKVLLQTLRIDGEPVTSEHNFLSFWTLAIWRQWYITKYTQYQCVSRKLGTFYRVIATGGDSYLPLCEVIRQMEPHFPHFTRIEDWNEVKDDLNIIKKFAAQNVAPLVQCKGTGGMRSHLTFMQYESFRNPWQECDEVE